MAKKRKLEKTKIFILKRVSYGSKKTLKHLREYRPLTIGGPVMGGPVGTKKEWRIWNKKHNFKLKFIDK